MKYWRFRAGPVNIIPHDVNGETFMYVTGPAMISKKQAFEFFGIQDTYLQPIDTAPTDGRYIILLWREGRTWGSATCRYMDDENGWEMSNGDTLFESPEFWIPYLKPGRMRK